MSPTNGPYDNARSVRADLLRALADNGNGSMERMEDHVALFVSTCLRTEVELGAYDLMAVRYLAVCDPQILQAFRSMLVRTYNAGALARRDIKTLPVGRAFN